MTLFIINQINERINLSEKRIKDESIRKNEIEDIDKDTSFNDDTTLQEA